MMTATVDNMTTGIDPETLDALEQRVLSAWPESSALAPEEVLTVIRLLRGYVARAEAAERVVEAALRDQQANRRHIDLCNRHEITEWHPEMIDIETEMVASAVDLDIALDAYSALLANESEDA